MKLFHAVCWGMAFFWATAGCSHSLLAAAKKPDSSDKDSAAPKKKSDGDHTHVVKRGETLWGIARKYEVSVGEMMDLNHMSNDKVHEGQTLKIPQPAENVSDAPAAPTTHMVVKGESLRTIARANGITQDELEHANPKVDPDHPKVGTKLKIPVHPSDPAEKEAPARDKAGSGATVKYVVREEDTFHSIARAHGLTSSAIAKANPNVVPERLRPGTSLVLPPKPSKTEDPAPTAKGKSAGDDTPRKRDTTGTGDDKPAAPKSGGTHPYVISHGESAASIADAFGISVRRLCAINGKESAASFKEGSEIQVPDNR